MQITVKKSDVNIKVLLYTGLFKYKDGLVIDSVDEDYIISYNEDPEIVCAEIEKHIDLDGDYSTVTALMVDNARVEMTDGVDNYLDSVAQEHRYDSMTSVRSYAGFDNPFRDAATKLAQWSADCWVVAGSIEADVLAGNREMPTLEQVISELPALEE